MRWLGLFFLSFFFIVTLTAEPVEYEPQEVATNEGIPSSIVNGAVCIISGEYTDSTTDIVIPGPEPFVLARHYGSHSTAGAIGQGWSFNHQDKVRFAEAVREKGPSWIISYRQPSGAQIDFESPKSKEIKKNDVEFALIVPKGLTNGASQLSGRTNVKNLQIISNYQDASVVAVSGAGHKRTFEKSGYLEDGWAYYLEKKLEKCNGSAYDYQHKENSLFKIACRNKQTEEPYSYINFLMTGAQEKPVLKVSTSDNREYRYHLFKQKYHFKQKGAHSSKSQSVIRHYLAKVESPYAPMEEYAYKEKSLSKDLQIVKKNINDRFLEIEYYHAGTNSIGKEQGHIEIEDDDDYRLDRVKKLRAPVGTTHESITTHRFVYACEHKKEHHRKKLLDGHTDVFDALNHKTRYAYDQEHRLTSIERFSGTTTRQYKPYIEECFEWGKGNDDGNLVKKTFKDGEGKIHHSRTFEYDERGNVIKSTLHGNLTGRGQEKEKETKTYHYSDDGLNLLLSETDSNGIITQYKYLQGTEHLKAKLVSYEGKIRSREFYFYENDVLVKKVVDDGEEEKYENLTGVKERHYTTITPRVTAPVGLPEKVVEEVLIDKKTGEKKSLKTTHNTFSPAGKLIKQDIHDDQDQLVYTLNWEYDNHGNLLSETDAEGWTITRTYDANDNLMLQEGPAPGHCIENTYDFANRLICQKETHPDKQEFSTHYHYDYLGQCIKTINAYGLPTEQTFDDFGRVIEIKSPDLLDENGNCVTPIVKKKYNMAGHLIAHLDARGYETKYSHNIRGQPTTIEYPDGTSEQMFYRLDGQLMEKVEKNGTRTVYKRDSLGRILEEAHYKDQQELRKIIHEYDSFHLVKTVDAEGGTTHYTYDKARRLEKVTQGDRLQQNFYDSLGRIAEIREFYGNGPQEYRATIRKYDLKDRIIEETLQDSGGTVLRDSRFKYDERGNRILTQIGGVITFIEYDAHHNPIKITNALNQETHIVYDKEFVNALGQKVLQTTTTDPLGYQTIDTYDAANRLVETERRNPFGLKVAHHTTFYDLSGNPCRLLDEVIEVGKGKETITTEMVYTADNQIESLTQATGTPDQRITRYHYQYGQKSKTEKPDGISLHYCYDALGRLKTLHSSDNSISYTYNYNKSDQVTEVKDERTEKTTGRKYDTLNQLVEETLAHGLSLKYSYDRIGRIKALQLPDQTAVEYIYDALNLKEVRRMTGRKHAYTHHNIAHNLSGQVTHAKLSGKSGEISYQYDALGRCAKISSPSFHQEVPEYGFDAAGNLLQFTAEGIDYAFTYDDHYNLASESGHQNHSYRFDSLSNRILKDHEVHTHNALNQVIKKGEEVISYDLNGNLIQRKGVRYTYDALDRLIQINDNGSIMTYTYDPFNRRLSKKQNNQEQLFLYQGQEEIGSWANAVVQELRLLGDSRRNPMVALELNGVPYVPLHDMAGHVVCLLNTQGEVAERYRYTAFGEAEIFSPSGEQLHATALGNPWQYASKRLDPETHLIAFGLRYYDPSLGRWLTPDPAGDIDGPNLYAYVHNSPLLYFDPLGLYADEFDLSWDPVFPDYYIASLDDIHHGFAGALHGGLDFAAHQMTGIGSMCCTIGAHDWDDPEERSFSLAFGQSCAAHLNRFDNWFADTLRIDPSNVLYQDIRFLSHTSLEIGSLAIGGYGIAKSGFKAAEFYALSRQAEKLGGNLALKGIEYIAKAEMKTGTDFIVGFTGIVIPTSRGLLDSGFQRAGFATFKTRSTGIGYILPDGNKVRIMEAAGQAPLRASFTNWNDGPINPFTGKPPQAPKLLDIKARKQFVREQTHIVLQP